MPVDADYGDLPISAPEQDLFGIDGFVQSLARSVRTMRSPNGVVTALNGLWGSGKSSAMNLPKLGARLLYTGGSVAPIAVRQPPTKR